MTFALPLLEWLDIPAGQVTLEGGGTFDIAPIRIARYPVTNAQFEAFTADGGYKDDVWWDGLAQRIKSPRKSDWTEPDAPKLEVSWFEAMAFCRWLGHQGRFEARLPSEWEWQWAAVGDTDWDYPFGPFFDSDLCNTKESGVERTNIVTQYADVKTPFGAADMAGNVAEWCLNAGATLDGMDVTGMENRALRGGSWNQPQEKARAGFRNHRTPMTRQFNVGFRVMVVE